MPPSPPKSNIYLTILFLMVANLVLGVVLMLLADLVWQNEALKVFGLGLALVAGFGYLLFRLLGRSAARRREEEERSRGEGPRGDWPGGEGRG
ncbi:MAG: hypothetical protein WD489_09125 [Rhodovibrionaceae bacterium]